MATAKLTRKKLHLSAARAIVHHSTEWWNGEITCGIAFDAAEQFSDGIDHTTPEDTANFLLLVAEAL